jgi:multidrug transporter EmrE-like cation transporter
LAQFLQRIHKTAFMGYLFLALTIILESSAVILMKLSEGFQHKVHGGLAVLAYTLSFVFFTLALKHMSAGIANALWAGGSALLVVMLGILFLKENISTSQWVFLALIITGIAGLQYSSASQ